MYTLLFMEKVSSEANNNRKIKMVKKQKKKKRRDQINRSTKKKQIGISLQKVSKWLVLLVILQPETHGRRKYDFDKED